VIASYKEKGIEMQEFSDSITYLKMKTHFIKINVEEGNKYYFET
jgi:hypothetical protein